MESKKERRDRARARLHEVKATLAEWKRAYVVEGIERPYEDRVTLEAEKERLVYELNRLDVEIHAERKAEEEVQRAMFSAVLVNLLKDRGLEDIVREARRLSTESLMALKGAKSSVEA